MAVEIRELVIKATIIQDDSESDPRPSATASPVDYALLVQECVREVIKVIENNKYR